MPLGKICDDPANFKKAYVLEKYVLHMIFSLLGVAAGTTVTVVANWFQGIRFKGPLWQVALFGFGISMAVGCLFLPLLLKYGSEKARIILLGAVFIPIILIVALVYLAEKTGAISTDEIAVVFQWGIPPVFIALLIISVLISQKIFEKKNFNVECKNILAKLHKKHQDTTRQVYKMIAVLTKKKKGIDISVKRGVK